MSQTATPNIDSRGSSGARATPGGAVSFRLDRPRESTQQIVESIYTAGLDARGWRRVLSEMATVTSSDVAAVYRLSRDGESGECLWQHGLPDAAQREYATWASRDALLQRVPSDVTTGTMFLNLHRKGASIANSPFCSIFLAKHRPLFATLAVCIYGDENEFLLLCCSRVPDRPDYTQDQACILDKVVAHMERSITLHRRLLQAESSLLSTDLLADALGRALFRLDANGCVLSMNERAQRLVELGDALKITCARRLRAPDHATNLAIDEILARSQPGRRPPGNDDSGFLLLPRTPGTRPYAARFIPEASLDLIPANNPSTTLVLVSNPYRAQVSAGVFRALFGATAAEAGVGALIANGSRASEISKELGTSLATVRTHIRRLLKKSSARDQGELVSIVLAVTR